MDKFLEYAEQIIIYRIRKAGLEISKLYNDFAAKEGATLPMGLTLLTIHPERGTPVTKIAPRMGMEPNSLSRLLNSLEKKGFIIRERDLKDKRKVYVRLTEKGKEKRAYAFDRVKVVSERILQDIEPEKVSAFFEVIDRVQASIAEMRKELEEKEKAEKLAAK